LVDGNLGAKSSSESLSSLLIRFFFLAGAALDLTAEMVGFFFGANSSESSSLDYAAKAIVFFFFIGLALGFGLKSPESSSSSSLKTSVFLFVSGLDLVTLPLFGRGGGRPVPFAAGANFFVGLLGWGWLGIIVGITEESSFFNRLLFGWLLLELLWFELII